MDVATRPNLQSSWTREEAMLKKILNTRDGTNFYRGSTKKKGWAERKKKKYHDGI